MSLFRVNVSSNDAFFRILGGLLLLALLLIDPRIQWAVIGAVLIITGMTRRCPVYLLAGIDSEKK